MSSSESEAEKEALDRFVDACLSERLGRAEPPDLVSAVLDADEGASARAAARIEAATREAQPLAIVRGPLRTRWIAAWLALLGAAAAVVALWSVGSARLGSSRDEDGRTATGSTPDPSGAIDMQQLIDEFHAAMPRTPVRLVNPRVRALVAPRALPVLRRIIAAQGDAPQEGPLSIDAPEFEVYAAALGAQDVIASVRERAANGDDEAAYVLDVAALITSGGGQARRSALATFAARIESGARMTRTIARALVATDLTEQELLDLRAYTDDEDVATYLARAAAAAEQTPYRLLGQPLVLESRTIDGAHLSTEAWRGEPFLVVFWASWCAPCEDMLAAVEAARERYGARTLRVLGVSCDLELAALSGNLAANPGQDWPQLFDPRYPGWHELAFELYIRTIPTVLLVGGDGVVRDLVESPFELDSALEAFFGG